MITKDYRDLQLDNSVIALGKFQGLHLGHMLLIDKMLEISREYDIPSIIFTINIKQEMYINMPYERAEILEAKGIDYMADCDFDEKFSQLLPEEFVKDFVVGHYHAGYVVVGEDFRFGANRSGDVSLLKEFGKKYGFEVIIFEKLNRDGHVISTSYVKELIESGKVDCAASMLGRPFKITGTVRKGKKLGRTIGFPTANIIPDKRKLLPKLGVYKTNVIIDGVKYAAMTNVGDNPTVDGTHGIFVESHIIDFEQELYGKNITVEFLYYIREQKKFDSVEELRAQLIWDKKYII